VRLDAKKILEGMDSLPLMKSGYSLEADMRLGWRPQIKGKVLPIPLVFDDEDEYFALDHVINPRNPRLGSYPTIFYGWRPTDSMKMHRRLLENSDALTGSAYPMKLPGELPYLVRRLLHQQMADSVGVR
jgi:hypothetical protein